MSMPSPPHGLAPHAARAEPDARSTAHLTSHRACRPPSAMPHTLHLTLRAHDPPYATHDAMHTTHSLTPAPAPTHTLALPAAPCAERDGNDRPPPLPSPPHTRRERDGDDRPVTRLPRAVHALNALPVPAPAPARTRPRPDGERAHTHAPLRLPPPHMHCARALRTRSMRSLLAPHTAHAQPAAPTAHARAASHPTSRRACHAVSTVPHSPTAHAVPPRHAVFRGAPRAAPPAVHPYSAFGGGEAVEAPGHLSCNGRQCRQVVRDDERCPGGGGDSTCGRQGGGRAHQFITATTGGLGAVD
ncbi:hypothetical protein GGX14DRAFT_390380 [Mycena pura]|uniref:Uncharacterized protein n=1 Tax=Mycena pura TaxID=153505 RepID=A0AAD6YGH4_9AGAR|nr:hypothetical protein GGX14DRAFT_390380 [Mycena pura]